MSSLFAAYITSVEAQDTAQLVVQEGENTMRGRVAEGVVALWRLIGSCSKYRGIPIAHFDRVAAEE